jgi:hypothetical protein
LFCGIFLAFTSRSTFCYYWPFLVGDPACNALDRGWDEATGWVFGAKPDFGTVHEWGAKFVTAFLLAAASTALWLLADRRARDYRRAHAWLRTFVRYLLAAAMLYYGAIKLTRTQFPAPTVGDLITPLGEFSRTELLWNFMGISRAYGLFGGLLEFVGGLLLLWRRTTTLGALVLLGAIANVAVLNFAYDVPVKAHSTIYLFMTLFLLAPDARRLADVLILGRAAPAARTSARAQLGNARLSAILKTAVVLWVVGANVYVARRAYFEIGNGAPRPPLYGIYEVASFTRPGVANPSNGTHSAWLRIAIGERGIAVIQPVRGFARFFSPQVDTVAGTLRLTALDSSSAVVLHYLRRPGGHLHMVGTAGIDSVQMELNPLDVSSLPLLQPIR